MTAEYTPDDFANTAYRVRRHLREHGVYYVNEGEADGAILAALDIAAKASAEVKKARGCCGSMTMVCRDCPDRSPPSPEPETARNEAAAKASAAKVDGKHPTHALENCVVCGQLALRADPRDGVRAVPPFPAAHAAKASAAPDNRTFLAGQRSVLDWFDDAVGPDVVQWCERLRDAFTPALSAEVGKALRLHLASPPPASPESSGEEP